jgi:hypothetical protein
VLLTYINLAFLELKAVIARGRKKKRAVLLNKAAKT